MIKEIATPRQQELIKTVNEIVAQGWEFKPWTKYNYGWWVLPDSDDPVKAMRRGDPQPFYQGAAAVKELYIVKNINEQELK